MGGRRSRKESFNANKIIRRIFVDSTYNAYVTKDFTNVKSTLHNRLQTKLNIKLISVLYPVRYFYINNLL
jgi:hypothetical protein